MFYKFCIRQMILLIVCCFCLKNLLIIKIIFLLQAEIQTITISLSKQIRLADNSVFGFPTANLKSESVLQWLVNGIQPVTMTREHITADLGCRTLSITLHNVAIQNSSLPAAALNCKDLQLLSTSLSKRFLKFVRSHVNFQFQIYNLVPRGKQG